MRTNSECCILVCWTLWFFQDKHWFEGQELDAMTVAKFARSYGDMLNHPSMTVLNFHGSLMRWYDGNHQAAIARTHFLLCGTRSRPGFSGGYGCTFSDGLLATLVW